MIRDVLVVMDSATDRAGPFALSLATQLNAFLTAATVTTPGPFEPLLCTESRYDVIEAARTRSKTPRRPWTLSPTRRRRRV
jgi:hypothetical protein